MKHIADALSKSPKAAHQAIQSYAWLTDELVKAAWHAANQMHPNATPTEAERLSVLAVGGYGRFEMAPFSDVDLLFLTPYKITPWAESVIESMLYMLWDLRLKVGPFLTYNTRLFAIGGRRFHNSDRDVRAALCVRRYWFSTRT
jgi:[protein-PII] uridylyltransferase